MFLNLKLLKLQSATVIQTLKLLSPKMFVKLIRGFFASFYLGSDKIINNEQYCYEK